MLQDSGKYALYSMFYIHWANLCYQEKIVKRSGSGSGRGSRRGYRSSREYREEVPAILACIRYVISSNSSNNETVVDASEYDENNRPRSRTQIHSVYFVTWIIVATDLEKCGFSVRSITYGARWLSRRNKSTIFVIKFNRHLVSYC